MAYENETVSEAKERFQIILSEEVGRDVFSELLAARRLKNDLVIPSK